MNSFSHSFVVLVILVFSSALFGAVETVSDRQKAWGDLAERINERLDDPDFANSHWGVLFESLDSEDVYFERNAHRTFIPASNQKILVSAAAYRFLGPDFTFTTTVHRTGEVEEGVLRGDLVVFGNGDPTLYTRFHNDSRDVFRGWAKELSEAGIRRVEGNIVGDDRAWEERQFGSSWPRGAITPWYYAEYGALTFNENYVDLRFVPPAEQGGELVIEPNVPSEYYELVNEIEVVDSGRNAVRMNRPMFSNTITLSGRVVAGSDPFEQTPTIDNPTLFYVTVLKEVLEAEGIEIGGEARDCDDIPGWEASADELPEVARHISPPLKEIIPLFMKRSQNMYGENLVMAMGWKSEGFGTIAGGRRVVEEELRAFGVEPSEYQFSDGSGLSRFNMVTPRMINAINREMRKSELGDLWFESQAIAGVDGTLRGVRGRPSLVNNVRAKTGTLSSVRALSGFITTADGEDVLFSMFNNGSFRGSSAVNEVLFDILEMVAEFSAETEE